MAHKYSSPCKVLEQGNKAWKLQVGERVDVVSRDRLKPHLGSVASKAAVPPKRRKTWTDSACGFCGLVSFGSEATCVMELGLKKIRERLYCTVIHEYVYSMKKMRQYF